MKRDRSSEKSRRKSRSAPGAFLRLGRLAVTRNLALALILAAGAVAIVLVVLSFSSPARELSEAQVRLNRLISGAEPEGGGFHVPGDPNNFHPLTHPELYIETEFSYACGCSGTFVPADHGILGAADPQGILAELKTSTCYKCRELLEAGRKIEQIRSSDQKGKADSAGAGG